MSTERRHERRGQKTMNNPEPSRPTSDAQPRSLHEVLDVLADRIEARQNSYHLAHSGLATHVFKTLADEIRAVAKETRSTSNDPSSGAA